MCTNPTSTQPNRCKDIGRCVEAIEKRCLELFARDYKYSVIHNSNGEVCGHYPRQIVFLEYECTDGETDRYFSTTQTVHQWHRGEVIVLSHKVTLLLEIGSNLQ
uniref:Uncharacterized protein n=1 Tax=Lates calcarifer TaxID=8187 RepID=A0A4W6DFC5_LATCA